MSSYCKPELSSVLKVVLPLNDRRALFSSRGLNRGVGNPGYIKANGPHPAFGGQCGVALVQDPCKARDHDNDDDGIDDKRGIYDLLKNPSWLTALVVL